MREAERHVREGVTSRTAVAQPESAEGTRAIIVRRRFIGNDGSRSAELPGSYAAVTMDVDRLRRGRENDRTTMDSVNLEASAGQQAWRSIQPVTAFSIRVATLLSGAVLMALEILAFRIIGKTFGSALRETSVVIGVFLGAMSIGYFYGGRIVDRLPRVRTFAFALLIASATTTLVPTLDVLFSERVFRSALPIGLHSTVVTLLLFFLPTMFLASVSPIAIRLLAHGVGDSGRTAGNISAISTIGSIAGSIGTAFFLIDAIQSVDRTIYVLAAVTATSAVLVAGSRQMSDESRALSRRLVIAGLSIVAGVAIVATTSFIIARRGGEDSAGRDAHIIYQRDSRFHRIVVQDHPPYRILFFDRQQQSRIRLNNPFEGALPYTDYFYFAQVVNPRIQRVLYVGVGGGSVPTRLVHDYPEVHVDAVEVDPVVIDVAKTYFSFTPGPRLAVHVEDGRTFVRRSQEKWDLIVIDVYSQNRYGATIPAHMTTREFFEECQAHLSPGGLVLFNSAWVPRSPITRAISKTLGAVFPGQLAFANMNTVLMAGPESIEPFRLHLSEATAAARTSGSLKFPLTQKHVDALVPPIDPGDAPMLTDDFSPVDTLIRSSK